MLIPGPAGDLEAHYQPAEAPADGGAPIRAVLCHPHPQFGGSMHDPVLDTLARVLTERGAGVLRFNFRGTGASGGRHDGGAGEIDDLLATVAWLQGADLPDDPAAAARLWVGGYSFGAYVAWQALGRGLEPERLLLLAPPAGRMAFAPRRPPCRVDVFAGDADEFAPREALSAWEHVHSHVIPGADHFFSGSRELLSQRIRDALG